MNRKHKLDRIDSRFNPQQEPLCPTKNPNRSTLLPLATPFSLRTPSFHQRHRLTPRTPEGQEPSR
ncbi:hypothetical protein [uncultured Aquitalea sp.]|uniref:hypothetical protein n=1 Tax=uncultured Aquitalea sp. TaxID=540272 RepID=UPI0025DBA8A2|nr:hypothetical protein [uncultured Aquitalea sp.]